MSAYVLQRAILAFYGKFKLFPQGLCSAIPAVADWALKCGATLKKLVGGQSDQHQIGLILTLVCAVELRVSNRIVLWCGKVVVEFYKHQKQYL